MAINGNQSAAIDMNTPSACVSSEWPVLYYVLHCSVFTAVLLTCCVNVNTTDATAGCVY